MPSHGKRRRAVVRLSAEDQRRLDAGEIADAYQAVGKPEPRPKSESAPLPRSAGGSIPAEQSARDTWLKENVPPHW